MKRQNRTYLLIALAIIIVAGFLTVNFKSNEADGSNLPDLSDIQDNVQANDMPINTLADINGALTNIVEETVPSVVTIRVSEEVTIQRSPIPPFFRHFFGEDMPSRPEKRLREGLGSGVIVSKDGYILTNNHVVADAEKIIVTLHNGREYKGDVIGRDPLTDVAVVKIDAENLHPLPIGNSDEAKVGEMVLAIGSPMGAQLAQTVTFGIISAKGRTIGGGQGSFNYYIQTDAAINPGNSGGALVDMNGQLIGINSAIISKTGGNQGIGLAVPSKIARSIMNSLIEKGEVERGYLGIGFGGNVDATMAEALDVDVTNGVIISNVEKGSPADKAGLKEGDIVYKINGKTVKDWSQVRVIIGTSKPGDKVTLGIVQDGKKEKVEVTLGKNKELAALTGQKSGDQQLGKTLGFDVENLDPRIAQQLGLKSNQNGVIVTDIDQTSDAYRQGLRSKDIIIEVSDKPVKSVNDFAKAINSLKGKKDVVLLHIIRAGRVNGDIVLNKQYIAFKL
ncbi:MAG TPA: Do family serine endopeptidase [Balneolaceae bacterium]|nr:Do family serine endopeptidase [Balneolaceae bacterium]